MTSHRSYLIGICWYCYRFFFKHWFLVIFYWFFNCTGMGTCAVDCLSFIPDGSRFNLTLTLLTHLPNVFSFSCSNILHSYLFCIYLSPCVFLSLRTAASASYCFDNALKGWYVDIRFQSSILTFIKAMIIFLLIILVPSVMSRLHSFLLRQSFLLSSLVVKLLRVSQIWITI